MLELAFTLLAGSPGAERLLVLGPSLGTSVESLWTRATAFMHDVEVVGWDLPGHGRSLPADAAFTVADLADAVRRAAGECARGRPATYAGVSLGGAVGLQLALGPGVFGQVTCIAGAARIGEPSGWHERASLVRAAGTSVMVPSSAQRWFAPGFLERDPVASNELLRSPSRAHAESYALACEALAAFDLQTRLAAVRVPLLVVAGERDVVVPPPTAEQTAMAAGATFQVLTGCGHLPPAEDPTAVAALLRAEEAIRD